ncbi:MucBP domain-containing protein, partial [uncultured Anaerococcus sp.]
GSKATGNYKPGVTQEITYVYEKTQTDWTPIEETGKFQEHHIYITKDEDGKEIKREIVDGKITGGTKEMTYTTGRKEKDGFKFVRTENPVEDPSYNDNGDSKEGNFKPGVKQEITYVYEKTVKSEKPSKPTTPTTPSKPEEPTVPSTPEEPTVPSTPEEPTVPSTPEEPEKTTPLISFTPADPIDKAREVIEREENNRNVVNENKVPGHKNSDNPKTGIASSLGAMGTLAASALAFIGLDDKKRKNK